MPATVVLISLSALQVGAVSTQVWQQQIIAADLDAVISLSFLNPGAPFLKLSDRYVPCVREACSSHKLSLPVF